jgi:hypothetical protein
MSLNSRVGWNDEGIGGGGGGQYDDESSSVDHFDYWLAIL